MKLISVFFLLLFQFVALSKEDTLMYKKRVNLTIGFDLSIPQKRSEVGFQDKSLFNSLWATPIHPVYSSTLYQNAWNLSLNTDIRLYKKLYFQTGFYFSSLSNKTHYFGDSLGNYNHNEINTILLVNKIYSFIVPLQLQYRFNKYIFASVGITINAHTVLVQETTNYTNLLQVGSTDKNVAGYPIGYGDFPFLIEQISTNIKLRGTSSLL